MLLIYRKDLRNQQTSININMKLITLTKESYLPGILNGNIRSRQKVCDKHCRLLKGPLWGQSHISGYRKWSNAPLMVHRKEYRNALPTKYFLQKRGEKGWSLGRNSDVPQHTLCGDRWGRRGRRELTTCLPPLRFHINHWLLKRVLGDWKQNNRKRTDFRVRPRYKSPFCYRLSNSE